MHEIITIQLGHFANFVGTHFWNAQESYFTYGENEDPSPVDHNIHFRAGLGVGNIETFTPRALIYDLKGGFGSLRKINQLYQDETDLARSRDIDLNTSWSGKNETRQMSELKKHKFQESLDEGTEPEPLANQVVQYWSDFNRLFYHPRSSIQFNDHEHANPLTPFDSFDLGTELFENSDKQEDILDRQFRPFAEECDLMQGLQLLTTVDDGWGGFATRYINNLRDEYPKSIIWTWALERTEKKTRDRILAKTTASVQSLIGILPSCTTYVPINIPRPSFRIPSYIKEFDPTSPWQTSALIASALETCMLPTRLKAAGSRIGSLAEISMFLNASGNQQISTLNLNSLNNQDNENDKDATSRNYFHEPVDYSWGGIDSHTFSSYEVIRGLETKQQNGDPNVTKQPPSERCYISLPFPVLSSFPEVFEPPKDGDHASVKLATSLKTSSSVIEHLKTSQSLVNRLVALDEREAISNGLGELWEAYQEGWGSDSDDFYD